MNEIEQRAIDLMLDPARYVYAVDRERMKVVLRGLVYIDQKEYAKAKIRQGMKETMLDRTLSQRQWQARISRRPKRAAITRFNQPDPSRWATRERYVRAI